MLLSLWQGRGAVAVSLAAWQGEGKISKNVTYRQTLHHYIYIVIISDVIIWQGVLVEMRSIGLSAVSAYSQMPSHRCHHHYCCHHHCYHCHDHCHRALHDHGHHNSQYWQHPHIPRCLPFIIIIIIIMIAMMMILIIIFVKINVIIIMNIVIIIV